MKIAFRLLFTFTWLTALHATGQPTPFGSVTKEELLMSRHSLDTSAQAIILFDVGTVSGKSYMTSFERHLRIKLFSKETFDTWGTQKFLARRGSLSRIRAATYYLENGEVRMQEVSPDAIFKTRVTKQVEEISLAFSNLREGCILELEYTERNKGVYLPPWIFQYNIPNLWSEYAIHTPLTDFKYLLAGTLPLTDYTNNPKKRSQRWLIRDIPAFKAEPLMPDPGLYVSSLRFAEGNSSWATVYASYVLHPYGGGVIRQHPDLHKKAYAIVDGLTDPKEKIRAISDYIKQEVKWNGIRDIHADPPEEVLENGEGTSGDINLLLGCLLHKAGFKVSPVLLSSRDNGLILEEATELSQFDYVICHVELDGASLFLDATEKLLPFDMLPGRCYNHNGFLVEEMGFQWIQLEPDKAERIVMESSLSLSESGELTGKVKHLFYDYAGFHTRKICEEDSLLFSESLEKTTQQQISNVKLSGLREKEMPVKLEYDVSTTHEVNQVNEKVYLNPFSDAGTETNPFSETSRQFPVDFPLLTDLTVITRITIPENYMVESMPESSGIVLPDNGGKCIFNFGHSGNQLFITLRTQITKTFFQPEEYLKLKAFYSQILARKGESIVLQKRAK